MKKIFIFIIFTFFIFNTAFAQTIFNPLFVQQKQKKSDDFRNKLKELDKKIEGGNASESDYISRGKLNEKDGDYEAAEADYNTAENF